MNGSSSSPLKPCPGIDQIRPHVPGQTAPAADGRSIKLSANESALGPSPNAIAAFHGAADGMFRYPDAEAFAIRSAIGKRYGVNPGQIIMGIGSDELLGVAVRSYAGVGDEVVYPAATFPMYRIYALSCGAKPVPVPDNGYAADIDGILRAVTPQTKVVIIANPNNPTGTYVPKSEMMRLRAGLRDDIFLIIDAAYAEYVEQADYDSGIELVEATKNTAMTRTFSKIHGLAGLRVGWIYACPEIISVVGRVRSPFNVSNAAQAAGIAAIEDVAFQEHVVAHTRKWRQIAIQRLSGLGLTTTGTEGNFVCFRCPEQDDRNAAALDQFLRSKGISIRAMAGFGLPNHTRMTIGRDDETSACLDAIAEFYS
ncbi:MAG: histidinol-phosphate transaminase [Rhodobacteraceae bacterium]|nr:histidinol-phosphate transaminase [Paracoccaceae bacterium]